MRAVFGVEGVRKGLRDKGEREFIRLWLGLVRINERVFYDSEFQRVCVRPSVVWSKLANFCFHLISL